MIDINKEAQEYAKDLIKLKSAQPHELTWVSSIFIKGHNSKATQAKVLQAQIDLLSIIYSDNKTSDFSSSTFQDVVYELEKLQQQLKELQDERN
jgi:hypothetical protein